MSFDDSQSGFVTGRDPKDAIFVVWQLQEKCLAINKQLDTALLDLEKSFREPSALAADD